MLLEDWLRSRGGAAHSSDIRAAGFSKHAMTTAVGSGRMLRLRRSWIAVSDADSELLAAVGVSGRLACVSAARRLGLWVPVDTRIHVAVSPRAARFASEGLRVHWSTGPAPASRRATVEPLINVLYHVARCQEPQDALAIWESALNRKLVDSAVLQRVAWRSERANSLASISTSLSDSGLESHFVGLMREIGVVVSQQVWIDDHPVDGLIGDLLVIQIDGFAHHSNPADRRRDIDADARLRLRGYTVLRFDYFQILYRPELVKDMVQAAIAQGLHHDV